MSTSSSNLAIERAKKLFGAEHANVQPHSGSQANVAVYLTMLQPGDTVLAMDLSHGGHLTHGHTMNFSGKFYKFVHYGVSKETETIDYDALEILASEHQPKMIAAGASAYSRIIDFPRMRQDRQSVRRASLHRHGAHRGTRRGGRASVPGAACRFRHHHHAQDPCAARAAAWFSARKNSPRISTASLPRRAGRPADARHRGQGGRLRKPPSPNSRTISSRSSPTPRRLRRHGEKRLPHRFRRHGQPSHARRSPSRGHHRQRRAARSDHAGITVNKNAIPFDPLPKAGGIRLGTPAVTTRGMREPEMEQIAGWIADVLTHLGDANANSACAPKSRLSLKIPAVRRTPRSRRSHQRAPRAKRPLAHSQIGRARRAPPRPRVVAVHVVAVRFPQIDPIALKLEVPPRSIACSTLSVCTNLPLGEEHRCQTSI